MRSTLECLNMTCRFLKTFRRYPVKQIQPITDVSGYKTLAIVAMGRCLHAIIFLPLIIYIIHIDAEARQSSAEVTSQVTTTTTSVTMTCQSKISNVSGYAVGLDSMSISWLHNNQSECTPRSRGQCRNDRTTELSAYLDLTILSPTLLTSYAGRPASLDPRSAP